MVQLHSSGSFFPATVTILERSVKNRPRIPSNDEHSQVTKFIAGGYHRRNVSGHARSHFRNIALTRL